MEKKQTAVDFLLNTVIGEDAQGNDFYLKDALLDTEIYQAKQMEKENIIEAFDEGQEYEYNQSHYRDAPKFDSETYYNETYKTE